MSPSQPLCRQDSVHGAFLARTCRMISGKAATYACCFSITAGRLCFTGTEGHAPCILLSVSGSYHSSSCCLQCMVVVRLLDATVCLMDTLAPSLEIPEVATLNIFIDMANHLTVTWHCNVPSPMQTCMCYTTSLMYTLSLVQKHTSAIPCQYVESIHH